MAYGNSAYWTGKATGNGLLMFVVTYSADESVTVNVPIIKDDPAERVAEQVVQAWVTQTNYYPIERDGAKVIFPSRGMNFGGMRGGFADPLKIIPSYDTGAGYTDIGNGLRAKNDQTALAPQFT